MFKKIGEFVCCVATPLDAGIHWLVVILKHLVVSIEAAVSPQVDIDNDIDSDNT